MNNNMIVFDIETVALPIEAQKRMMKPRPEPPVFTDGKTKGSRTAADKLSEWIAKQEEEEQEWLDEAALHAERSRVALIGYIHKGDEPTFIYGDDEKLMLTEWWTLVREQPEWQRFAGHNILHFDIPFLMRRSMIQGVSMPSWLMSSRGYLNDARFFDTVTAWQCGDRKEYISLDRLSKAFGLDGKTGSGADFGKLWAANATKALEYCKQDLVLTKAVVERMGK